LRCGGSGFKKGVAGRRKESEPPKQKKGNAAPPETRDKDARLGPSPEAKIIKIGEKEISKLGIGRVWRRTDGLWKPEGDGRLGRLTQKQPTNKKKKNPKKKKKNPKKRWDDGHRAPGDRGAKPRLEDRGHC